MAELLSLIYNELRKQAAPYLRRAHFFGIAAQAMRRILIDHARTRQRDKRGGAMPKVELEENHAVQEALGVDVLALDQALTRLAATA
jgi:ECF sigma factor